MRFPKPWTKKRGKRLLGGTLSGVVGESAFYASQFLLGVFMLALMLFLRFANSSQLVSRRVSDAMGNSVSGVVEATGEASSSGLGFWIVSILALAMIAYGGFATTYRLAHIGASDERRKVAGPAAGLRTSTAESSRAEPSGEWELPAVPQGRSATDSPGVRLNYRLASEGAVARHTIATAALALLWNAVWFVLLAVVVSGFLNGTPRWVLAFLLLPFGAIGLWAFRYFLNSLKQTAGVGATIVEISSLPLHPGHSYDLYVRQAGRLDLRRLRVELICEEETMFRQGTDVRIDRHVAMSKILANERDVSIDPQRPWEQELQLDLPAGIMHSFRSAHNAVCWRITVSGDARPWPSFCLNFPVFVHPAVHPSVPRPR